uniref:Spermatosis and centriole associated 1 like n=1 Tax=Sphenodon punctatus TaxID=8508 RepID=A0A8D0HTY7_SPHPU
MEEGEWMKRIQEENAHLKNQVRLLRENYELRLLLGQHSENSNQMLTPRTSPAYPDASFLGQEVFKNTESPVHLMPSLLEEFNYSPISISSDAAVLSSPCAQTQTKGFLNDPTLCQPKRGEKKTVHLLSTSCSTLLGKQLEEPTAFSSLKKTWLTDASLPGGDKAQSPLHDIETDPNSKKNGRIVGEIAFQLDRRILAYVFPGITRLYGYTVSNIPEKIKQASMKSLDGSVDEKKHRAMTQRYLALTTRLEKMGYNRDVHPVFSEFLINTYGILKQRPDLHSNPLHNNPADLRKMVIDIVPSKFLGGTLLLLNCLCELSKEDNKSLFAW